jgi:glutaredoxin 3
MAPVRMYTSRACGYCHMALRLLAGRGIAVEQIHVDVHPERRGEMIARTGRTSVPQIFIGDRHVGGYTDLVALDRAGALAPLLAPVAEH